MTLCFSYSLQGPRKAGLPVPGVHLRRPQALPRVRHHKVQRGQGHRARRRREYRHGVHFNDIQDNGITTLTTRSYDGVMDTE